MQRSVLLSSAKKVLETYIKLHSKVAKNNTKEYIIEKY